MSEFLIDTITGLYSAPRSRRVDALLLLGDNVMSSLRTTQLQSPLFVHSFELDVLKSVHPPLCRVCRWGSSRI
ncbi:hypothetical protein SERLADRAFT_478486 [Serpula lacrymans var. lacrymans S7.9]|uniref:Uncharacterized protein n=1 Tax=Serpula lacrymans var. lacrymans (strain S7.9) TaxID=578457 RepID=F8P9V4_SERL9|nr:uncharacterized protein SERLADRAFT_478486 [Serpula lacrymans var. lacrymans S7.9]EGO19952.1 hypothetical protein SERLADRAFT_478486 [Serpula lacrymans var. lacrymans S7.9]